jgi:predicted GH43/DUF377 family glycosyl hydrolase
MQISSKLPASCSWVERFKKYPGNPVLRPGGGKYHADSIFNPAACEYNGKIGLLCRCMNLADPHDEGVWAVSSLGWAWSDDGFNFKVDEKPTFFAGPESPYRGGFEDARVVKVDDTYYAYFTGIKPCKSFDWHGENCWPACLATSKDLKNWQWHGEILPARAVATTTQRINGKYWAYFDNNDVQVAWSDDLIKWNVLPEPAFKKRPGYFDETLCEPGPPPIVTPDGILLIYNGCCGEEQSQEYGNKYRSRWRTVQCYRTGWALFALDDPARLIARCEEPFLIPDREFELWGDEACVIFTQGLVHRDGKYFLYYGCADTRIGVAVAE